jgi:ubiquinone/menaquinone biosynthesis C-methylase UbiE
MQTSSLEQRPEFPTSEAPAHAQVMQIITGYWASQAIYLACKLGVPDQLAKAPRSAEEIAAAVGVHPLALYRVMRALTGLGVLGENERHEFALTPLGECLRSDAPNSLRWLSLFSIEVGWAPWGRALDSVRTGRPTVEEVYGRRLFEHLEEHPDVQEIFSRAMGGMAKQLANAVSAAYDFSGVRTVVDVGGGYGTLLIHVLEQHPDLKGVVFDLPHVVEQAEHAISQAGMSERCRRVGGSFFESVPPGGDLYTMSYILHDWDDPHAAEILARCREAMEPGTKLAMIEVVIPPPGVPSFGKLLDLEMLVMAGGRERTEDEYRRLLDEAGFELRRVIGMQAPQSIIEAVRRDG